jgi:hypothetical protein
VKKFCALTAVIALSLFAASASAQFGYGPNAPSYLGGSTTIGLKAIVAEHMTFTVTNPVVNFNIFDTTKTTNGDNTVGFTANYVMKNGANFAVCVASNFRYSWSRRNGHQH